MCLCFYLGTWFNHGMVVIGSLSARKKANGGGGGCEGWRAYGLTLRGGGGGPRQIFLEFQI